MLVLAELKLLGNTQKKERGLMYLDPPTGGSISPGAMGAGHTTKGEPLQELPPASQSKRPMGLV